MKAIPLLVALLLSPLVSAHEDGGGGAHGIVPESERARARDLRAEGPQENRGIGSVSLLGEQSITGEDWVRDERRLRVREIVIQPGGVVAVHQHQGRPGMAYILEGSILEHRNDAEEPLQRDAGAVSFEKTGIVHWWENTGEDTVRALVVDLVPEEPAKEQE